jgi:hypothetical protein
MTRLCVLAHKLITDSKEKNIATKLAKKDLLFYIKWRFNKILGDFWRWIVW